MFSPDLSVKQSAEKFFSPNPTGIKLIFLIIFSCEGLSVKQKKEMFSIFLVARGGFEPPTPGL